MAVTKIRKFSSWTLLLIALISIVILGIYYFGGRVAPENQIPQIMGEVEPTFTGILLYWMYILLFLVVAAWLIFSLIAFFVNLKNNSKKAIRSLFALAAIAALLIVTYLIGDGTPLNIVGYEGSDNVPKVLNMTDMWLYSIYVLLGLCIVAMILSPIVKKLRK